MANEATVVKPVTAPEVALGAADRLLARLVGAVPKEVLQAFSPLLVAFALLATFGTLVGGSMATYVLVPATALLAVAWIIRLFVVRRVETSIRKVETRNYKSHIDQLIIPESGDHFQHVVPADVGLKLPGYQNAPDHETRLIAFVSGKGGVGKSVIALGLFEHLSAVVQTQLVDFDFHNKGLTSLLRLREAPEDVAYLKDLMEKSFLSLPALGQLQPFFTRQTESHPTQDLVEGYRALVQGFIGDPSSPDAIRAIRFAKRATESLEIPGLGHPLRPFNAQFVPSVRSGDVFLGSPASEANSWQVYLFLRLLALRARLANAVLHQIVDCHGAHDVLTAGAICAATHLVIVATPDMGSLEGTYELLRYSLGLRKSAEDAWGKARSAAQRSQRIVVVVNRCLADDPNASELESKWSNRLDSIVRVQRSERIERLGRAYTFGDISRDSYLRERVEHIASALEL